MLDKTLHVLDTQYLDTPEAVLAFHWSMAEMIKRYSIAAAAPDPARLREPGVLALVPLLGAVQLFGAMLA